MRYLIVLLALTMASPIYAQSKKQLISQLDQLKKENTELKSQIEDLKKPKVVELADTVRMVSYSLGALMAGNLKSQGGDSLKVEAIAAGMGDAMKGKKLQIGAVEGMVLVQGYMQDAMALKTDRLKKENTEFLEKNKSAEGVKTTASGLQYKVISSGKGKAPKATDKVTVHYTGKLIDGSVFDSSVEKGAPATFDLTGIIPGWTEALQLMHEGDKWMIYLPSELAYGERGAGEQIPPYSTLVFDVELIKVN
ncbi:MAG: FKBP-type peptidyl-prolyl cis-trans isomerase [Chryseolinea sp.]